MNELKVGDIVVQTSNNGIWWIAYGPEERDGWSEPMFIGQCIVRCDPDWDGGPSCWKEGDESVFHPTDHADGFSGVRVIGFSKTQPDVDAVLAAARLMGVIL